MDEDIVNELRDWAHIIEGVQGKATLVMLSGEMFTEAANEIELLRSALQVAAGLLSTYLPEHPLEVLDYLMEEARRG